jgi:hypothetical protein
LDYSLMFRWFLDLNWDEPGFEHSGFRRNRARLLDHDVAGEFFRTVVAEARELQLTSDPSTHSGAVILYRLVRDLALLSTPLYVDEVVQESELVVRQAGTALGVKSRLAARVAAPPLALSPNGCKGKKSRIARRGKPR